MGFLVATSGRLLLPSHLERQALTVAEHRMAARDGWFDPDAGPHVDTLADLAAYAGVTVARDGDWLTVTTDHQGDPKWSEQAEEFYRSLAGFVQDGEVNLRGEDGSTWSYAYSPAGVEQRGGHGFDAPPPAPEPTPPPAAPAPERPVQLDQPDPPDRPSEPDQTPPSGSGAPDFIDYPGRTAGPPSASPPQPPTPPTTPPGMQDAGWAGLDADPPPAPPQRVLLMTVALIVGVALIIGLALLASGF